ncbi:MAG: HAD-IC family P-type ATPase, partial [Burkholderiales bacterium]
LKTPLEGAIEETGRGVRATIDGVEARLGSAEFCGIDPAEMATGTRAATSFIAFRHGDRRAVLAVSQTLRPDAVAVVARLKALGLELAILSGDRAGAVAPIASALGIAQWHAGLKPAEKIAFIERLKGQGRRVLMVGDGLNDAPALAAAHASVSPISAAHITQAQADAVFMGERLTPVLDSVMLSRRARALMRQNLWLAVIYNAVAVPVAVIGLVTPLIAAAAMSGSSILVTLNALRARTGARSAARTPELPAERKVQPA